VWPAPEGIGVINEEAWDRTVEIAKTAKNLEGSTVITTDPPETAHTNEYIERALGDLKADDLDLTGESFQPIQVTLAEGGK
jgi:NitT/TauT family transport system substrate-binding protein